MTRKSAGFSLLELLGVVIVMLIVSAIGIPQVLTMVQNQRIIGDAKGIAAQLALARMRAASENKPVELTFSLAANTYQLQTCTSVPASVCNTAAATYAVEGGTQNLSQGVSFGFGAITTPVGGQAAIAQTSPITFNSRGISVDGTGNPTGTAVVYIINGKGACYAVTVSIGGQATVQQYTKTAWRAL